MKHVYLVRHGSAVSEQHNPRRPLRPKGREEVLRAAAAVAKEQVTVSRICHSSKLRAKQTAELLAQILKIGMVEETEGLSPRDDPDDAKARIDKTDQPLMLVGHLPHLSNFVSALTRSAQEVPLHTPNVVALMDDSHGCQITWRLLPSDASFGPYDF